MSRLGYSPPDQRQLAGARRPGRAPVPSVPFSLPVRLALASAGACLSGAGLACLFLAGTAPEVVLGVAVLLAPGLAITQILCPLDSAVGLALTVPLSMAVWDLLGLGMYESGAWRPFPGYVGVLGLSLALHLLVMVRLRRGRTLRPSPAPVGRAWFRVAGRADPATWVLTLAGAGLVAWAVVRSAPASPGVLGLLSVLPVGWYVGLGLLVLVVCYRLATTRPPGASVILLVSALAATPAALYAEPRYTWTAKQLGPVLSMAAYHHLPAAVGIYRAWPGFFAGMGAWFDVSHHHGLVVAARWWPVIIDLAAAVLVRMLGESFGLLDSQAWFAALLFSLANFVGQDYFSPQSVGLVLGLAILVANCWLLPRRTGRGGWGVVVLLGLALVPTHPLTPFLVAAAGGVVAFVGRRGSRLVPVALLGGAGVWAGFHISEWRSYLPHRALGHVVSNAMTPSTVAPFPRMHLLWFTNSGWVLAGGTVLLLATARLLEFRSRTEVILFLAGISPAALLAVSAYGNEAVFRVGLFALPWAAILAARFGRRPFWEVAVPLSVPFLAAAYLISTGGTDWFNTYSPQELSVITSFERTAPTDSTLVLLGGNAPLASTARTSHLYYEYLTLPPWFEMHPVRGMKYVRELISESGNGSNYFLMFDTSGARYLQAYGLGTESQIATFRRDLLAVPGVRLVASSKDATLYRLPPGWIK